MTFPMLINDLQDGIGFLSNNRADRPYGCCGNCMVTNIFYLDFRWTVVTLNWGPPEPGSKFVNKKFLAFCDG